MQTFYFEYFKNSWSYPSIMIVSPFRKLPKMPKVFKSTCRKLWCLSAFKKSTSSLTYFLRYCNNIEKFWELCKCETILIKIVVSTCSKLSCLSACKKSTSLFTSPFRYAMMERKSKLFNLGNLGMPGNSPKMLVSI